MIGTLLGVGGTFFFVLYKGKEIHLWSSRIHLGGRPHSDTTPNISILAAFLALGGVISYSFWVLLQVNFSFIITLLFDKCIILTFFTQVKNYFLTPDNYDFRTIKNSCLYL